MKIVFFKKNKFIRAEAFLCFCIFSVTTLFPTVKYNFTWISFCLVYLLKIFIKMQWKEAIQFIYSSALRDLWSMLLELWVIIISKWGSSVCDAHHFLFFLIPQDLWLHRWENCEKHTGFQWVSQLKAQRGLVSGVTSSSQVVPPKGECWGFIHSLMIWTRGLGALLVRCSNHIKFHFFKGKMLYVLWGLTKQALRRECQISFHAWTNVIDCCMFTDKWNVKLMQFIYTCWWKYVRKPMHTL